MGQADTSLPETVSLVGRFRSSIRVPSGLHFDRTNVAVALRPHNRLMDANAGLPREIEQWAERLQEWERLRRRAVEAGGKVYPMQVTDYVVVALTSGIIGNVGYDLLKTALRAWRKPEVRLPAGARGVSDALLLAVLATQARCVQIDLPAPALADLEALECRRDGDRWRIELRRVDRRGYTLGGQDWPGGVALGASVVIPDGPLTGRDIEVKVVAKGDVEAAQKAEYQRIKMVIDRLYPKDPQQP
jgi:hypothetical protein